MSIKKITYVVYYRNDEFNIINTLESILNQRLHVTDFDVVILNDGSSNLDQGTHKIREFIKKNKLINFNLIDFDRHLGISAIFAFLNRAGIIKSEYVTFLKSGDILNKKWSRNFLDNLYPMKIDMYIHNFDKNMRLVRIEKKNNREIKREYVKRNKNYCPVFSLEGEIDRSLATSTLHIFFGKIFKYSRIKNMRVFEERILYQDFYIYQKMISVCATFYYSPFNAGKMEHRPWFESSMDKQRIILLCKTIDRMISRRNLVLNGMLLQMLAIAIKSTDKLDYYYYIISNFKYLQKNFKLTQVNGFDVSKSSARKMTKNLVKSGKLMGAKI